MADFFADCIRMGAQPCRAHRCAGWSTVLCPAPSGDMAHLVHGFFRIKVRCPGEQFRDPGFFHANVMEERGQGKTPGMGEVGA